MARTNGPIQVWSRADTTPTDGEGGYAGGDSTAAAIATAGAQALAAQQTIQNLQGVASTLPAGSAATVTVSGSGTSKTINIGIPRGEPGMGYAEGLELTSRAETAEASANAAADRAELAEATALAPADTVIAQSINNPQTETSTALAAAVLPWTTPAAAHTVALVGDSITWRTAPRVGYSAGDWITNNGWLNHANARLGQRLDVVTSYAASGKRLDQMLAEQIPPLLALTPRPGWATVLGGANDIIQGRTAAQMQTDLAAIWDSLTGAGITVLACTIPPQTGLTGAQTQRLYEVNRWIKAEAPRRRGVHLVDWFTALVDATGVPVPGILTDNVHPTARAASIMGRLVAETISSAVSPRDVVPLPGDPTNLHPNPHKTEAPPSGSPDGYLGAGVTGTSTYNYRVASADASTPTAVASVAPRSDGIPGRFLRVAPTAGNVRATNATVIPASGGQVWQATAEVICSSDLQAARVSLLLAESGGSKSATALGPDPDVPDGQGPPLDLGGARLILRTLPLTLSAATTGLYAHVQIWGGTAGHVDLGRISVHRLS